MLEDEITALRNALNQKVEMKSSHDVPPEVYEELGIDISELGCIMLRLESGDLDLKSQFQDHELYFSASSSHWWVDGFVWDKNPHITILYGLLKSGSEWKNYVDILLEDWEPGEVEVEGYSVFPSPTEEPYSCVVAKIKKTPGILEGYSRLSLLPHINTFASYRPHATIAYVRSDYEDDIIRRLESKGFPTLRAAGIHYGGKD